MKNILGYIKLSGPVPKYKRAPMTKALNGYPLFQSGAINCAAEKRCVVAKEMNAFKNAVYNRTNKINLFNVNALPCSK